MGTGSLAGRDAQHICMGKHRVQGERSQGALSNQQV